MKIKKYLSMIVFMCLIIFSNNKVFGQNPDTVNYFPHHLEDVWEYYYYDHISPSFDTLQSIIIFDSTDAIGNCYVIQERYFINPYKRAGNPHYIIDDYGDIYEVNSIFLPNPFKRKIFKNDAQVGEWWIVDTLALLEIAKLRSESIEYLFGIETTVRKIEYYYAGDTSDTTTWWHMWSEKYAQNFGLIWIGEGETFTDIILKGCLINGILYGDTTFVTFINQNHEYQFQLLIQLNQNYPNPFNIQTNISFKLKKPIYISLIIYNLLGQELIRLIDNKFYHFGEFNVIWNGEDRYGKTLPSGEYWCLLKSTEQICIKKLILLK